MLPNLRMIWRAIQATIMFAMFATPVLAQTSVAENTPAETFIDNVDRLAFDNWNEHITLYPEGKAIVEMSYPRAKAHRQVPQSMRERLYERGARLYGAREKTAA